MQTFSKKYRVYGAVVQRLSIEVEADHKEGAAEFAREQEFSDWTLIKDDSRWVDVHSIQSLSEEFIIE
jgi:hypothetical protein